jgi:hypothetical protein
MAAGIVSCLRGAERSNGREHAAHLDSGRVADRVMSLYQAYGVDCSKTGGAPAELCNSSLVHPG